MSRDAIPGRRNLWQVFRWPLLLAVASIVGLVSALVGDGAYDALSWLTLGLPVAVVLVAWRPGRHGGRRKR